MTAESFHFEHAGETYTLPLLRNIKVGVIRKYRKLEGDDQMWSVLEEIAPPDVMAAIDDMDGVEFETFAEKWTANSGVSLGEA